MGRLSGLFNRIPALLFPATEEALGEVGEREREFVRPMGLRRVEVAVVLHHFGAHHVGVDAAAELPRACRP